MMDTPLSAAERRRSVAAVAGFGFIFSFTYGFTFPLLSLILEGQGVSTAMIGINSGMTSVGFLVGGFITPQFVKWFGLSRVLFSYVLITALTLLLARAIPDVNFWFPLRVVMGIGQGGLYLLSAAWINLIAQDEGRGRIIGIFITLGGAGYAVGPLLIPVLGTDGWEPFIVAVGIIVVGVLPVLRVKRLVPTLVHSDKGIHLWSFFLIAPVLLAANALVATADAAALSLLPIYAIRLGYDQTFGTLMLVVFLLGSVLLQLPIGWLADKVNRYRVLFICAGVGLLGGLLLPYLIPFPWIMWPAIFVWGGLLYGLSTVSLTIQGERFSGRDLVVANAAFSMMWGMGGIGPAAGGIAMDWIGPHGLPLSIASACLLFLVFILIRQPHIIGIGAPKNGD